MMNNYFWLVLLPNLDSFFCILGVAGIVAASIVFCIYWEKMDYVCTKEHANDARNLAKRSLKLFASAMIMFFITCFIPTKKDIIQLKIISAVSELKGVEQIPQKLIDRLGYLLEDKHE